MDWESVGLFLPPLVLGFSGVENLVPKNRAVRSFYLRSQLSDFRLSRRLPFFSFPFFFVEPDINPLSDSGLTGYVQSCIRMDISPTWACYLNLIYLILFLSPSAYFFFFPKFSCSLGRGRLYYCYPETCNLAAPVMEEGCRQPDYGKSLEIRFGNCPCRVREGCDRSSYILFIHKRPVSSEECTAFSGYPRHWGTILGFCFSLFNPACSSSPLTLQVTYLPR